MNKAWFAAPCLLLLSAIAPAYVDTPIITPATPTQLTPVFAAITRGVCDALIIPPDPVVETSAGIVELRVRWIGHTDSSLCTFGDVTTSYALGTFAPGEYELRVIGIPSPGGIGPTQLASTTFAVQAVSPATIPAAHPYVLVLLALMLAAVGARHAKFSS